jgi:hypothetical protein
MDDEEDIEVASFEDCYAQRAIAFCHLARFAEEATNETARDLTFTMMRKLSNSIKSPSTAELHQLSK